MAYRHYETEGLIIGYRNLGEANRLYQVLTDKFGLVAVLAQGVRRDRSKLRYHLKNLSFANLVLVRGREFWRVVGVNSLDLIGPKSSLSDHLFLKKLSLVLQRLVHGEELNSSLYRDIKQAWLLALDRVGLTEADFSSLEIFVLARLLMRLGYLALSPELKELILAPNFTWVEIGQIKNSQVSIIKQINQALEITQL